MKKAILLLIAILLWSCAKPYTPPDYSGYLWPKKPEKTRVKLLKVVTTDLDVRSGRSASEKIFGQDVTFAFRKPHGIDVDDAGNIYVVDTKFSRLTVFNFETGSIKDFNNPYGWPGLLKVAVDSKNRLLAGTYSGGVAVLDLDKQTMRFEMGRNGEIGRASSVAFDPERKVIYVSDSKKHQVLKYDYTGKLISVIATLGADKGKVYFPSGLDVDSEGRLYVVDTMNFRVQVFNPDGSFRMAFGEHGDSPGDMARPKDIAVSKDGFVLVTDAAFNNFQIFDREGKIYMFVGRGGNAPGAFQTPQGIAVGPDDKIYVADSLNRRFQVFQLMTDAYYEKLEAEKAAKQAEKAGQAGQANTTNNKDITNSPAPATTTTPGPQAPQAPSAPLEAEKGDTAPASAPVEPLPAGGTTSAPDQPK